MALHLLTIKTLMDKEFNNDGKRVEEEKEEIYLKITGKNISIQIIKGSLKMKPYQIIGKAHS